MQTATGYPPGHPNYGEPRDGTQRDQTLSNLSASLSSVFNRSTVLRDRLTTIREFLSGGGNPPSPTTAGPREVPSGLIGNISETRDGLSYCFDSMESEIERIARALGIDGPATSR